MRYYDKETQRKMIITFSRDTVKKWLDLGIKPLKCSKENKAKKPGWYFLESDIEKIEPDYVAFINRPFPQEKKKIKTKIDKPLPKIKEPSLDSKKEFEERSKVYNWVDPNKKNKNLKNKREAGK